MAIRRYNLKTALKAAPRLRIDYAAQLNDEQLAVVEAGDGPLLVIAGAGSGKTRTLCYRVARLLEQGVRPEEILLLTFTNRAAREMVSRVQVLVGEALGTDLRRLWGGTFHRAANLTLREYASELGYAEGYGILDREDTRDLMKSCVAELGLHDLPRRFPKAELLLRLTSMAVNTQRALADLLADRYPHFVSLTEPVLAVAARYAERKAALNLMDFDDLLLNWKLLLTERPAVQAAQGARFRYVLVDEYQDTNRLQGDLVDLISSRHQNLMVVGDDAQSIYAFRGAHFANIMEFPDRHPGCEIFHLGENYRSTPQILALANASIARNTRQFKKTLFARREDGPLPAVVPSRDVYEQAAFVAQRLLELRDEGIDLRELAVLYRAHHHSLELQVELSRRGIPFVVRSGTRFFEQAHIKDVVAHLRFVLNPRDELAFKRMVRLSRGVGGAIADRLWRQTGSLERFLHQEVLDAAPVRARSGLKKLQGLLASLLQPSTRDDPGEMIRLVLDAGGYADHLREHFLNGDGRVEDLEQLADFAGAYDHLGTFLDEIGLLSELEAEDVVEGSEPDEQLCLSTIHKAKGLEWRGVFVIWLADGRFPVSAAYRDVEGLEEERRLFYVAATRAKDELYLCYPITHTRRDQERVVMRASPFLEELPDGEAAPYEKWSLEPDDEPPLLPGGTPPLLES